VSTATIATTLPLYVYLVTYLNRFAASDTTNDDSLVTGRSDTVVHLVAMGTVGDGNLEKSVEHNS